MNSDASQSPREELEARITALLLGELSPAEEAVVREAIAKDPSLAELHARLQRTVGLVAEAARTTGEHDGASVPLPRLSAERRQKLLDAFKVIPPGNLPPAKLPGARPAKAARREWLLVAAMLIGLLGLVAVVIPNFVRARSAGPLSDRLRVELLATRREFGEEPTTPIAGTRVERSLGRVTASTGDAGISKGSEVAVEQRAEKSEKHFGNVVFDSSLPAEIAASESVPPVVVSPPPVPNASLGETVRRGFQIALPNQAEPTSTDSRLYFRKADEPSLAASGEFIARDGFFEQSVTENRAVSLSGAGDQQGAAVVGLAQTTNTITALVSDSKRFGGGLGGLGRAFSGFQPAPTLSSRDQSSAAFAGIPIAALAPVTGTSVAEGIGTLDETTVGQRFLLKAVEQGTREYGGTDASKAVTDLQTQYAYSKDERLAKKPVQLGYAIDDRFGSKQGEIVLPGTPQLAELEKLRVATGPVASSDIAVNNPSAKLPALEPVAAAQALKEEALDERKEMARVEQDLLLRRRAKSRTPAEGAPVPQPEIATVENAFSTFSLNVSDVSFKLAAAALEQGRMPDAGTVRSEEFINAFDYRDPEPAGGAPIGFRWERARDPFTHDRDLLRFSVKTAASGRQPGRPLNLVLLLDNSGSMERADRIRIRQECLRVLAGQLQPQDRVSVVAFARTARLWVDGLPGGQGGELPQRVGGITPEGGTNLEDAMNLAYQTARRHFLAQGMNRVVLLTDGAANLGDVQPDSLRKKVETYRQQGIALDCFGIGWDGLNDELLEALSRNGDGRYGFVNTPEAAASEFAAQLAGALKVAASDVKVQVEWNPRRVTAYRQIGYAKHQLKKEQFRDNTVDAAEIGAAEAGNALYAVQVNPAGEGPLGVVRVRFKVPGTGDHREQEWPLLYDGNAKPLDQSTPALRLAACASAFSEWLVSSPFAAEVTPDKLLGYLAGVPATYSADPRPKKLEWMIREAGSLAGK